MNCEDMVTIDYDGKCKCCLDNLGTKSMWEEYYNKDEREVYGEMLMECFAVTWDVDTEEYICDSCITRLRNAVNLKVEFLAVQELLKENIIIENGNVLSRGVYEKCVIPEPDSDVILGNGKISSVDTNEDYLTQEPAEYLHGEISEEKLECLMDIENTIYLENEFNGDSDTKTLKQFPDKKRKRKPKSYKLYTTDEMEIAKDAVKVHGMTPAEAARKYGVPRKTLSLKLSVENETTDLKDEDTIHEKQMSLINEVRAILRYTNAVPFKTKAGKYFCAYCPFDKPPFDDADQLSHHTRSYHADSMIRQVEHIMRPPACNEVLKINVVNLTCTVCDVGIEDWNFMFTHFAEAHDLEFDEAYNRVIPYSLATDLKCVLCSENFTNFRHLDSHMNGHFCNYICYECGDPFLSSARLDIHLRVHKIGKYPCESCNKVFALEKYRSRHIATVHKNVIKCEYCPKKFVGDRKKYQHMVDYHPNRISLFTCDYCDMGFKSKTHLLAHKHSHSVR